MDEAPKCRRCEMNPAWRGKKGGLCWDCIKKEGARNGYSVMDRAHAYFSNLRYAFEKEK